MVSSVQRMLALPSGKRVSMKLDEATWQAIDWLAEQRGKSWQDWSVLTLANMDEGENMTAALREAAMSGLMEETIFADRAGQLEAMELHPLMRNSGMLNDQQLEEILSKARVAGHSDFGGFSVFFGLDEYFQDCIWIKNELRDGLHFAFVIPNDLMPKPSEGSQP
jgi:predicted DNA-binding ribbon-helix-helix protein